MISSAEQCCIQDRKIPRATIDVLPLYEELRPEIQAEALAWHPSMARRIVVATSIAETSICVPGVQAVVDFGLVHVRAYAPNLLLDVPRMVRVRVCQPRLSGVEVTGRFVCRLAMARAV